MEASKAAAPAPAVVKPAGPAEPADSTPIAAAAGVAAASAAQQRLSPRTLPAEEALRNPAHTGKAAGTTSGKALHSRASAPAASDAANVCYSSAAVLQPRRHGSDTGEHQLTPTAAVIRRRHWWKHSMC